MAATRLIALHVNKSKGASASMHERIEYTAAEEFLLASWNLPRLYGEQKNF